MAKKSASTANHEQRLEWHPLGELHFDTRNPRFGGQAGKLTNEIDILDTIVDKFGVEDVLSSLAFNGYFDGEPLVGLRDKGGAGVRIVEGNRRLAACLILAGDKRAANQKARTRKSQSLQKQRGQDPITEIPVSVFEESEWKDELLPYLGVRHIAASQPWDSYAKAAWIAQVLKKGDLTLEEVIEMIGDQHRTTSRMLEGYYFVHQLLDEARFKPSESHRRGRGSNPDYPFSWVYTALGFSPVRRWLKLDELSEGKKERPIHRAQLDDAEDLVIFLFGNKDRAPAIRDSRRIADLAKAVADPARRRLLKRGKTVDEVIELSRPAEERVVSGLMDAQEALSGVLVTLSESQIKIEQAKELVDPSKKVLTLARDVYGRITRALTDDEDEEQQEDG
ncbi:MAG: hypothetical protein HY040_25655 [Planctomycetes bacterium]|nr:hypothetical protein [Planctomycetota bacterium]